jgi:hypothetical protein
MTQPATSTAASRLLRAFSALVRAEDPDRTFAAGPWEYSVSRADGSTFDGAPTEQGLPLPPLRDIPYRGSIAGATCNPTVGTLAYVCFANGDPSRPILMAFGQTLPQGTTIDSAALTTIAIGATSQVINLGGAGAAALAVAAAAAANMTALATAISTVVIVPGDGGASIKAAIIALLGGGFPVSMATTKVIGK